MGKQRAQESHARRRFYDRYGIQLTDALHQDLVRKIQDGRAVFVEKQSNRVSVFDLNVEGQEIEALAVRVVYDRERHIIVSALPPSTVGQDGNWRLVA
jgi:hypothetical protein